MRAALLLSLALCAAGCGRREQLTLPPGAAQPVTPAAARAAPTVEALLTPPTQARPQRSDELLRRSEARPTDRFELPPQ